MKIRFVGSGMDGCYLYRCYNPTQFSKHDVKGDYDLDKGEFTPNQDLLEADIVIFHRPMGAERLELMRQLKMRGIVVGYDNDDTWKLPENHRIKKLYDQAGVTSEHLIENNKKYIEIADFVTTTTEFLAQEYKEINDNVYVLPNLVNFNLYGKPKQFKNDKTRILLTGSVLWGDDANHIQDLLKDLDERPDVQLVLFGDKTDLKNAEHVEKVSAKDYHKKLGELNIDLCLIPRADNYFNRAKSNCKYLEMSAYNIPVMAQSFTSKDSPYDLTDGPMILATNDWKEKVEDFIKNKPTLKAREYVFKNYNAELNKFDDIIDSLIKQFDL